MVRYYQENKTALPIIQACLEKRVISICLSQISTDVYPSHLFCPCYFIDRRPTLLCDSAAHFMGKSFAFGKFRERMLGCSIWTDINLIMFYFSIEYLLLLVGWKQNPRHPCGRSTWIIIPNSMHIGGQKVFGSLASCLLVQDVHLVGSMSYAFSSVLSYLIHSCPIFNPAK